MGVGKMRGEEGPSPAQKLLASVLRILAPTNFSPYFCILSLSLLPLLVKGEGPPASNAPKAKSTPLAPSRDLERFPACVTDMDCKAEEGYKCFQYMCFPWNSPDLRAPFRTCKRRSDCTKLKTSEGGDGGNGDCYRHQDRRNVFSGICLAKREIKNCFEHKDCGTGMKCINQVCGDPQYLDAILDLGCEKDNFCVDLLLGSHCCFDLSGGLQGWNSGKAEWGKKCCSNPDSPVIPPPANMTESDIEKLNLRVKTNYAPLQLDGMICRSLDYALMEKMEACTQFKTTTTTTTTTRKPKTTPKKNQKPKTSGVSPTMKMSKILTIQNSSQFLLLLIAIAAS